MDKKGWVACSGRGQGRTGSSRCKLVSLMRTVELGVLRDPSSPMQCMVVARQLQHCCLVCMAVRMIPVGLIYARAPGMLVSAGT